MVLPSTQVTEEDIDQFAASYRGSEKERTDVLAYYQRFGGDMAKVGLDGRGGAGLPLVLGISLGEEGKRREGERRNSA